MQERSTMSAASNKWNAAHPEIMRAAGVRYRATHKEQLRAYHKQYYQSKGKEKTIAWQKAHPEKVRETQRRIYEKRRADMQTIQYLDDNVLSCKQSSISMAKGTL